MRSDRVQAQLILSLLGLPGVGPKTARKLLDAGLDANAAEDGDLLREAIVASGVSGRGLASLDAASVSASIDATRRVLDRCNDGDIAYLCRGDARLPQAFWRIDDAPLIMFARGRWSEGDFDHSAAVIGTREPTEFGAKTGFRIASRLAEAGIPVVSGLAIGCDTVAHEGCLSVGGKTAAVMAHGLDTVHPAKNRGLAVRVVEEGGILLSEYPPGVEARPNRFIERDRLQSAMSRAVVVIETDIKGGTMHTVGYAKQQHRLLACVQHPEHLLAEPKTRGNQELIRTGQALALAGSADLQSLIDKVLGQESADDAPSSEPIPENLWGHQG
ncbi:MAG: DNA-protecting protein DprA [Phycisphaerales bacterium]|nr:DNA-protecting protein DprA [Phycisphaerales bacterium]